MSTFKRGWVWLGSYWRPLLNFFLHLSYSYCFLWEGSYPTTPTVNHEGTSEFSMKNLKSNLSVEEQSQGTCIHFLNQSEQPYCCLIGQYFYKSELRVCKKYTITPYFDTDIEYMNFKIILRKYHCIQNDAIRWEQLENWHFLEAITSEPMILF